MIVFESSDQMYDLYTNTSRNTTPANCSPTPAIRRVSKTTMACHLTFFCHRLTAVTEFVGDQSGGVTPDPFPNSAVKPTTPMILQQRESRSLPTYEPRRPKTFEALFIYTHRRQASFRRYSIVSITCTHPGHILTNLSFCCKLAT